MLLDRAQKREVVLAVNEATGKTRTLLEERDNAWINLVPMFSPRINALDMPKWLPDGSGFLWASEKSGTWQLELRHADGSPDHAITPAGFRFDALNDIDLADYDAIITASPDRLSFGLYRIKLAAGSTPEPVAAAPGLHDAAFAADGHASFTDSFSLADGTTGTNLLRRDGTLLATLPSRADKPPQIPQVEYTTVGPRLLDAAIIRPTNFDPAKTYPVVLSVYAGPGVKNVLRAPHSAFEDQCLADQGPFIVVTLDGRGTPGRDHDFERATADNLIDAPLADQVDGLEALGARIKQIDLKHAGVEGWSFGGYFTAMATIRRPDVFAAGAAGAPVIDFGDYDTAYTERYLGVPAHTGDSSNASPAYKVSNVLTYASTLQRPLLIMHGLTDDNVYFENTVKLTQALLAAGKPYQLLLLPGTHLLPDAKIRARVDEARATFLRAALTK